MIIKPYVFTNHAGYFIELAIKETYRDVIEYVVPILREMSLKKLTFDINATFLPLNYSI